MHRNIKENNGLPGAGERGIGDCLMLFKVSAWEGKVQEIDGGDDCKQCGCT